MTAQIGSPAPDFTLRDTQRAEVSLSDFRGKKTLLVFIPFPFTQNCETELCTIRDNLASLNALDANVVVITTHALHTNRVWAEQQGFEFPILADYWPHGAVAQAYGCFNEIAGSANRATYVLDEEGVVRDIIATDSLGTIREYSEYTKALAAL
jgi:peroxiredoxin